MQSVFQSEFTPLQKKYSYVLFQTKPNKADQGQIIAENKDDNLDFFI